MWAGRQFWERFGRNYSFKAGPAPELNPTSEYFHASTCKEKATALLCWNKKGERWKSFLISFLLEKTK